MMRVHITGMYSTVRRVYLLKHTIAPINVDAAQERKNYAAISCAPTHLLGYIVGSSDF
jgi:hypothetical protein